MAASFLYIKSFRKSPKTIDRGQILCYNIRCSEHLSNNNIVIHHLQKGKPKMIDPKIQKLIPEDFLEAVKNAYEEDDMYVVELNDGWEASNSECKGYETTIKVHKEPEDEFDTLEYRLGEGTWLKDAEVCPVCGRVNSIRVRRNEEGLYKVGCNFCRLWYDYMYLTEGQALAAWRVRSNIAYPPSSENSFSAYEKYCEENGLPVIV